MITIKFRKHRPVRIRARGNEFMVIHELAFGAAACINEISEDAAEFERIKKEVINELEKFKLTDNGETFDYSE